MIELEGVPELVDPVMVAAFEGWNDAGDAASAAVAHLEKEWKGEVFAALDAEDYYDFQVNRPHVWLDGGVRKVTWPTTRLSVVRVDNAGSKRGPRDLVLVRGIEPSMRWRSFCNELLGFAHELGVEMVVVLGALLGDTPHSRPVPVTGVTSDPDLARTMNLDESRYEGPTGINGVLQEACAHAGVPAVSLWASVPHYVSQPPNPKATLALLNRLEDLLGLSAPLGDLPEDARAWQLGVDQLAAEDSEVAEYVQSLEEARDTAELPEASGEAIAKEFERYLRRRDDSPSGGENARESGRSSYQRGGGESSGRRPKSPTKHDETGQTDETGGEAAAGRDGAEDRDTGDRGRDGDGSGGAQDDGAAEPDQDTSRGGQPEEEDGDASTGSTARGGGTSRPAKRTGSRSPRKKTARSTRSTSDGKEEDAGEESGAAKSAPSARRGGKTRKKTADGADSDAPDAGADDGTGEEKPKKRAPRKQTQRKQAAKKQTPRKQAPRKQAPRKEAPKKQAPRKQTPRKKPPEDSGNAKPDEE